MCERKINEIINLVNRFDCIIYFSVLKLKGRFDCIFTLQDAVRKTLI